jgi:uncharacterized protein with von Willebrand factor type A (vWA) domain
MTATRACVVLLHAIDRDRTRLFARLTNITRHLRQRDVDVAIARVSAAVSDYGWHPHRRLSGRVQPPLVAPVLGQGAIVLLITDGLDSDVAMACR